MRTVDQSSEAIRPLSSGFLVEEDAVASDRDPVDGLSRAVDQTEAIISRVRPDQATLPTPCSSWDVQALADHVVHDVRRFTARASGDEFDAAKSERSSIGEDWVGGYRRAADSLLEAWRKEGAVDRTVELPFGTFPATWFVGQQVADLVVHGWDIAKATGQPTELDPELGQFALEWGRENLRPEFRGKDFGPEVPVPDDAPLHDRLAGFFGRDPNWTPPTSA
jgi:uncharacterized protein (TIGR03086 family)